MMLPVKPVRVSPTVTFCELPPRVSVTELELTLLMAMLGLMVNLRAPDVPPPGEGFTTVTEAVPAAPMSLAKIAAVNCVPLTKVVARALPFHCTVEVATKFVPVTVIVNPVPPAPTTPIGRFRPAIGCAAPKLWPVSRRQDTTSARFQCLRPGPPEDFLHHCR